MPPRTRETRDRHRGRHGSARGPPGRCWGGDGHGNQGTRGSCPPASRDVAPRSQRSPPPPRPAPRARGLRALPRAARRGNRPRRALARLPRARARRLRRPRRGHRPPPARRRYARAVDELEHPVTGAPHDVHGAAGPAAWAFPCGSRQGPAPGLRRPAPALQCRLPQARTSRRGWRTPWRGVTSRRGVRAGGGQPAARDPRARLLPPRARACNRANLDSAVSIHSVEHFLGDSRASTADVRPPPTSTGRQVLVIGGGPGGLSAAYQLARLGHAARSSTRATSPAG